MNTSFLDIEDEDFRAWMIDVDQLTTRKYDISILDLPDLDFWSAYAAGTSPMQFVNENVREMISEEYGEEYGEI